MGLAAAGRSARPAGALRPVGKARIRHRPLATLPGAAGVCPAFAAAVAAEVHGAVVDCQWTAAAGQSAVHRRQGGSDGADRAPVHPDPTGVDADRLVCLGLRYHHALEGGLDRARARLLAVAARQAVERAVAAARGGALAPAGPEPFGGGRQAAGGRGWARPAAAVRCGLAAPADQAPTGGGAVSAWRQASATLALKRTRRCCSPADRAAP